MSIKKTILYFTFAILPLIVIAYLSVTMDIETQTMTRDVAAIARLHPIAGFLSNFGMIMWCIAATTWFFTSSVLKDKLAESEMKFLKHFGLLSAYLGLDDFFQLHEVVGPEYLHIPEKVMMLSIVLLSLFVFLTHRKKIMGEYFIFFLLSGMLLAGSVVYDSLWFEPPFGHWNFLIEDSMKWLGICLWASYAILKAKALFKKSLLINKF